MSVGVVPHVACIFQPPLHVFMRIAQHLSHQNFSFDDVYHVDQFIVGKNQSHLKAFARIDDVRPLDFDPTQKVEASLQDVALVL